MFDEGYIKFDCTWIDAPLPANLPIDALNTWRQKLYKQQLIGAYNDGVGYGNISCRLDDKTFLITGTKTGNIGNLTAEHFTHVTGYNFTDYVISCRGPVKASSESLTHSIIYASLPEVNAVVHIHHPGLWQKMLNKAPTTSVEAAYGTPEMALEISRLLKSIDTNGKKIIVMAGHEAGLISFGKDLAEAAGKFLV